jgi:predicted NBD/HSP70 family sugar kinase
LAQLDHILEKEAVALVRVLEQIRREGPITQIDISRRLGIGPAAVNVHIKKLVDQRIVIPTGKFEREGGLGRPRALLDLAREGKGVLGICLDSPNLSGAVMDFSSRIVVERRVNVGDVESYVSLADRVRELVRQLLQEAKKLSLEIFSVCFSVPGVVEMETGRILNYVNMPAANGLDAKRVLGELMDVPVYVVSLGAAIYWGGLVAEQADKHICHVIWDLGVGMMFGRGYEIGFKEYGSEPGQIASNLRDIGHTILWPNGKECHCGRRGCLEAYLGGRAIVDRWNRANPQDPLTFSRMLERAGQGKGVELNLIARNARRLGETLGWIFAAIGPRHIKLSGQIPDAVPVARDAFWDGVSRRMGGAPKAVEFDYVGDTGSVELRGACQLALHVRFNKPLLDVVGQDGTPTRPSSTIVVG